MRHFWECWSREYLIGLRRYPKWKEPRTGDTVVLKKDNLVSTQWHFAQVTETTKGNDGLACIVKLKTKDGQYTRPAAKVALLLPCEN